MTINDNDISKILAIVFEKLKCYYLEVEGIELVNIKINKIIKRGFSTILMLDVVLPRASAKLVFKQIVHDPINIAVTKSDNQAVVEYNVLNSIYPFMNKGRGFSVPKPILVIPEIEAFVMEYVDAKLLSEALGAAKYWSSDTKFRNLEECFYSCGLWLKEFQTITGIEYQGVNAFDKLIERCNYRLDIIQITGANKIPNNFVSDIKGYIQRLLSKIKVAEVPISGAHGDFGHWNIMVAKSGITVFDFMGHMKEVVVYDLYKMLNSFEYWKNNVFFSNERLDKLKCALLNGYGDIPQISSSTSALCELYHHVCVVYACLSSTSKRIDKRVMTVRALNKTVGLIQELMNDGQPTHMTLSQKHH